MCPVCDDCMLVLELDGIDIDWCERCHGTWFDAGELGLLMERHRWPRDVLDDTLRRPAEGCVVPGKCPRCRGPLLEVEVDGIPDATLTKCSVGHGMWCSARQVSRILGRSDCPSVIAGFLGQIGYSLREV